MNNTSSSTNAFQRAMASPAVQRLRALEQTRIQRARANGQRLVRTLKHADESAKTLLKETAVQDATQAIDDIVAALDVVAEALRDQPKE